MSNSQTSKSTPLVKRGLAEMMKGGVIMDVVTPEQAKIAEDAGAVAVMALERVPADIRAQGGVSRMSDPDMIDGIIKAVSIPVMAKARIGHFVEAQILQALKVDYIDESEVLSPADYVNHIDKWKFDVPFVCGATNLGEALRRITEGAAMIRSKGEAGTGDVSEAMKHIRTISGEIRALAAKSEDELYVAAKELQAPYELVREVASTGKLPVVMFVAGALIASRLMSYVGNRISAWLDPLSEANYEAIGGSYQLVQSMFGLAHGGIFGTGLGGGLPTIVPLAESDFIISAIGEELGLAGLFALLSLYMVLVARALRIANTHADDFSKLLAVGLGFVIALQCFIVIGGVLRVVPLTGLTTPLLAAGGSSLVANWIIIALLLRLSDTLPKPGTVSE